MHWEEQGSNGSETGDDARGHQQDQRAIALRTLSQCEGSFVLVCDEADGPKMVACLFAAELDEEEFQQQTQAFLESAREAFDQVFLKAA